MRYMLSILLLILSVGMALAVRPDEILDDPELEARARALSTMLRCMVCQNQSIDDSDAPLARDLRVRVRERLKAGDSDAMILDHMVARYGDFILLKPRLRMNTLLLWSVTPLMLLGGIFIVWREFWKRGYRMNGTTAESGLNPDERRRLDILLARRTDDDMRD